MRVCFAGIRALFLTRKHVVGCYCTHKNILVIKKIRIIIIVRSLEREEINQSAYLKLHDLVKRVTAFSN